MAKEKILITGASGFVGSHVLRRAQEQGYEVHLLTHRETPLEHREAVQKRMETIRPHVVLHLATSILMSGKTADPAILVQTNIQGTINVMDAAHAVGVEAFINTGTFAEYGPKDHPAREDERCDPRELYAISKLTGTLYGQGLAARTGFPCITLRLFTPYGPNMREKSLVKSVLSKTLAGSTVKLTKPTVARDFVYVEDVAKLYFEAAEKAAEYKGQVFNVGSGNRTTLKELVETVEHVVGKKAQTEWGAFPTQSYDSELWQADMQKTFSHFAWRPNTSLLKGISKAAEDTER